ncbi:MAG: DNA polymerase III subunit delta', partial [Dehalococcoidales bacterium]|nr:DNA polymerase III subunit delta' [Dehalococcoidales bacterium]
MTTSPGGISCNEEIVYYMWQIIGQDRAVSLLKQSLDAGKMSHAYLFTGSEHVGKMTLALQVAQALNCENPVPPCGECSSCRKIAARNHPDVQIIGITQKDDGAEYKVIRIDQIEYLQHDANLPPFEGKNKVFIIDTAELLSQDAANRFLKTLEEPVPNVTFILLTVNERLLPETVVSRCLRLELLPVPASVITPALIESGINADRADLLARLSHGCPGWAIEAIRDESLLQERDEELDRMLGLVAAEYEDRFSWAGQVAGRFTQNRKAVYAMLDGWLDYW